METATPNLTINFSANHSLLLKLNAPHFSRRYGYTVSFTEGLSVNKLKYEVEVTYLKTLLEKARLFKLDRVSPVYINDTEPDLLIDQLVYEIGKVFYPLIAEIDFNGKFLKISNVEEIQKRWLIVKEDVSNYFIGEEVEKYVYLMDEAISDEQHLNDSFENDLFISTYFANIYKSYTSSLVIEKDTSFPLAGKGKPVQFRLTENVERQLNEFQAIEIHHQGTVNDERSAQDIEEEYFFPVHRLSDPSINTAEGSYEALYILNKDTKAIESVVAKWTLSLKSRKEVEVKIFEIETEASLKASTTAAPAGSGLFYLDGGESSTKEESLIDKLKKILPWQKNT